MWNHTLHDVPCYTLKDVLTFILRDILTYILNDVWTHILKDALIWILKFQVIRNLQTEVVRENIQASINKYSNILGDYQCVGLFFANLNEFMGVWMYYLIATLTFMLFFDIYNYSTVSKTLYLHLIGYLSIKQRALQICWYVRALGVFF